MKPAVMIASAVALALGFALGRATAPDPDAELATAASLRWGLEEPDWLTRTWRLSAYLQQLDPESLPAALEIIEPHLPWLVTDEIRLLMFAWTRFDPAGALRHALTWEGRYRRSAAGAAIYAWAFLDPEAALEALEGVEEPKLAEFMRGRLVAGWAHGSDKQGVSDYIAAQPAGVQRDAHLGLLAWELAKDGPDAVMLWAEDVPVADAAYKADVFAQASATLAIVDPESAAHWLGRHLGQEYARESLPVVIRSWGARDPQAALVWLSTLSATEPRKNAVFEAFRVWFERSPAEAERWLRAATPASVFDPAVRVMVSRTRRHSPALAMQWATTLATPELRAEVLVDVGRDWASRDPGAAHAWLVRSDLDELLRQEILAPAPPAS